MKLLYALEETADELLNLHLQISEKDFTIESEIWSAALIRMNRERQMNMDIHFVMLHPEYLYDFLNEIGMQLEWERPQASTLF